MTKPTLKVLLEERRLRTAFVPILLLAAGFPTAVACSIGAESTDASSASATRNDDDGGTTTVGDAGVIDITDGACASQPWVPPSPDAAADTCIEFKEMACGLPPEYEAVTDDCYLPISQCFMICHRMMRSCHATPESCSDGGLVRGKPIHIECAICPGSAGRRPEGFAATTDTSPIDAEVTSPVGVFFSEVARLEAASIDAFDRLKGELVEHGAPAELVVEAERARKDEIAHARVMSRLARRHGGRLKRVAGRSPRGSRPLASIARENMVEGCVRETFGALIAAWQAAHAPDPEVARSLEGIAQDELRHAALSWSIAKWTDAALSEDERAEIARARDEAIRMLQDDADRAVHPDLVAIAGLPSSEVQHRMLRAMQTSVWAA